MTALSEYIARLLALLVKQVKLMRYPVVRLSIRPSVRPSVNNSCYRISSEAIYQKDFIMVPVCWPYGVVVHLPF